MANEKEIIRDTSIFTIARYSAYFFSVLTGLLIAKVLGPASFGVYSALMLIVNYSRYSNLGLFSAMVKKAPFYYGKKQDSKAKEIEKIAFSGSISIIIIVAIILFISSSFIKNVETITINSIRTISFIIVFQQIVFFYQDYLRVKKDFITVGKTVFLHSLTYFIFIIFLIFRLELLGIFYALLVSHFIIVFYSFFIKNFRIKISFSISKMIGLMRIGFPLLTVGIMSIIFLSIDKIMIITLIDKTHLGYYSIAILLSEVMLFIPYSIGYIIFPHLLEVYGKEKNKINLKNYLFQPTLIISYLFPIFIGLVFITAPVAIYYILPKYIPGIEAVKIISCAVFFIAIISPSRGFLITIDKEKRLLILHLFSIILAAVLNYFFIVKGYGIIGVAFATSISFFVYSMFLFFASFRQYNTFLSTFKFFIKVLIPFIYVIPLLFLSNTFAITGNIITDILISLIKMFTFVLLTIPLLIIANNKTGIIKTFFEMFTLNMKKAFETYLWKNK